MKLKVHASGSSGNLATLTDSTGSVLMLDCGVPLQKVYRALEFNTNALALCLVSSYHGDHSKSAKAMVDAFLPVTMSSATALQLGINYASSPTLRIKNDRQEMTVGNWHIIPFETFHDSLGSLGYLIRNREDFSTVAYIPDTGYIRHTFPTLNALIVECNHDSSIEDHKEEIADRYLRVRESHMSLDRLKAYLAKSPMPELRNIVLVHLSDSNSNEQKMVSEIEKQTGVTVTAAREGLELSLDIVPF